MATEFTAQQIVYFGDSYSDTGAAYDLSGRVLWFPYPFDVLGYEQSFTNGDVWTEYLSEQLGVTELNYAIGGAEAEGSQSLLEYFALRQLLGLLKVAPDDPALAYDINLEAQVTRFLSDAGEEDLSDTAVWLFTGFNDYLNFILTTANPTPEQGQALVGGVVTSIIAQIQTLAAAGVGTIYVSNLPAVDFIPFTAGAPDSIRGLAEFGIGVHNALLSDAIAALQAAGVAVELVDINALSQEIVADPATFGFVAPLEMFKVLGIDDAFNPIFNPALDGLDEDQFAFWDAVHPTTAGHGVIAAYQAAAITHEVLAGTEGADYLSGTSGSDLIMASAGDDLIKGRKGADTILAGLGDDKVLAGAGDDIVLGGSGDDTVMGGEGNDVLAGNHGDDRLLGGAGNDVLVDGLGSDLAFGGTGNDVFLFTDAALQGGTDGADHDAFFGGDGIDTLYLALTAANRDAVETAVDLGASFADALLAMNIEVHDIESFVLVDDRLDLAALDVDARLADADLWGIV